MYTSLLPSLRAALEAMRLLLRQEPWLLNAETGKVGEVLVGG